MPDRTDFSPVPWSSFAFLKVAGFQILNFDYCLPGSTDHCHVRKCTWALNWELRCTMGPAAPEEVGSFAWF
jgi:hypothetical protein